MAAPGYYIVDPGGLITLPRPPRWESEDVATQEADIAMETNRLKRYVYKLGKRSTPSYIFRVPEDELAAFETLHDAVQGQLTPFYYVLNTGTSPWSVLYCRKEKDFMPKKFGPGMFAGRLQSWYDYTLALSQERTDVEISA